MAHTLIIGKSGTGKSTDLIRRLLEDDRDILFIDFNGDHIDELLHVLPASKTILFDASEKDYPIGFNIFDAVPVDYRPLVAASVVATFKSITGYKINTPVLDRVLYNSARLVLDNNETFVGMFYLLTRDQYRRQLLRHCQDVTIVEFWKDFEQLSPKERRDFIASTQSNLEPFITDSAIRNIIGQKLSGIRLAEHQYTLVKLPRHVLGAEKARLLGLLFLSTLYSTRPADFSLYIDQAPELMTPLLHRVMTDLDVSVTIALQQLSQLGDTPLLDSIDQFVSFSTGIDDSRKLRNIYGLGDQAIQLHELEAFEALVVSGLHRSSLRTQPFMCPLTSNAQAIRNCSRYEYAVARKKIEITLDRFIRRLR